MQAFAELLERLVYTPSRNAKLRLLCAYFEASPDPDRGYALAVLTDTLELRLPVRRILSELLEGRVDPLHFRLSRDYVGDTAETVALLWPEPEAPERPPSVSEVVEAVSTASPPEVRDLLERWLDTLDTAGRWALLKLLTGALRVGVSARLAKQAVADYGQRDVAEIEELWHGLSPPFETLFAWLDGVGPRPEVKDVPVFRPLMLANPLEDKDWAGLDVADFAAEWKWDGIRVQVSATPKEVRIFSRTGDDISRTFPDIAACFAGLHVVADGELLVLREGDVAPFNDLQQRLNRKVVSQKMLRTYPAHVRFYDLLFAGEEDLRALNFDERRERLEAWHAAHKPENSDVSDLVLADDKDALQAIWNSTRGIGIEGLMLKRRVSPYLPGRPKGHWYKWKRAPLTLDVVMMYAQRGSGRRSSYYSDYTFGAWRAGEEGPELVPVGKAYSGYTDAELLKLDKWIRTHTVDRYGPVRAVEPGMVLEVAFDAVHRSGRHKSGVAMRFPRIHRIRWDKPADEADTLATLEALIDGE